MASPYSNIQARAADNNSTQQRSEEERQRDREEAERIWQDHLKERRENTQAALNEIVKERNIDENSRPYLVVALKGIPPAVDYLYPYYNNNVDFMNVDEFPQGAYIARYGVGGLDGGGAETESSFGGDIASAEFEGVNIGSRRGNITIVDPIGVWPEIISNLSRFSNGVGRGAPNIEIIYGWTGLRNQGDLVQKTWGIVIETNFEMDDNGLMRLNLKFVESSMETIKGIKFLEFKDMWTTDPSTEGVEDEKMTVNEMIDYFIENTSVGPQLAKNRILMKFGKCADDNEADRLKLEDYSVRYGDSFYSKLNSFIAKARPPKDKRDNEYMDWAYKVVRKKVRKLSSSDIPGWGVYNTSTSTVDTPAGKFGKGRAQFFADVSEVITEIVYDWEPTPKPGEDDANTSFEYTNNAEFIGYLNWRPDNEGEDKYYDWGLGGAYDVGSGVDKSRSKTMLDFNLDLSTLKALHGRIGAQLESVLTDFDEKDWEHISEAIEKNVGEINADTPIEDVVFSEDDIERIDNGAWWKATGFRRLFNADADMESIEDYEERKDSYVNLLKTIDTAKSNTNESPAVSQLRALINRNVFRATCTILGDPTLGSRIEPMSAYFVSNFMTPSYFSKYFSGKGWLFQKATHKFSEDGSYHTELELLGQPGMMIPQSRDARMQEKRENHNL